MSNDALLLTFFKSLADANRLRIVGLLAHRTHTVEELAEVLGLRPSTVSHHLSRLTGAGLVSASVQGHYHAYSLDTDGLEARARALFSNEDLRGLAPSDADADGVAHANVDHTTDPYARKVLATFLDADRRLTAKPVKRKKFEVILRYALDAYFPDEGPWPGREVDQRVQALTDDVAMIRRGFIDHGFMTRDRWGESYARA